MGARLLLGKGRPRSLTFLVAGLTFTQEKFNTAAPLALTHLCLTESLS